MLMGFLGIEAPEPTLIRLKGFKWSERDFCRGWLITGDIGSGKTTSGILNILAQVFANQPGWGGCVIDEKGNFHQTLNQMAAAFGRERDLLVLSVRPPGCGSDWQPAVRFNLVGERSIPAATYAQIIVDTAVAQDQGQGNNKDQIFFRTQAQMHIALALEALEEAGYPVNLENVSELLLNEKDLRQVIDQLKKSATPKAAKLAEHFQDRYLGQPPEQLGGVQGTISNFLSPYTNPDIAQVFCGQSTFQFGQAIESGAIVCLSIANRLQNERRYVATFLKKLFYLQAIGRFDRPAKERRGENLLVLWADEFQHFVSTDDYKAMDVIRDAKATVVAATQSTTSLNPPLGQERARVVTLNLRNRIIFKAADEQDAIQSAEFIGKRKVRKVSWNYGKGGSSRSESEVDEFWIKTHQLRRLRKHQCVLVHCEKPGFRKVTLAPVGPDGRRAPWY